MERQPKIQDRPKAAAHQKPVPQMQIHSDVRSGQDIQGCADNVEYWQQQYDIWYDVARRRGYL